MNTVAHPTGKNIEKSDDGLNFRAIGASKGRLKAKNMKHKK